MLPCEISLPIAGLPSASCFLHQAADASRRRTYTSTPTDAGHQDGTSWRPSGTIAQCDEHGAQRQQHGQAVAAERPSFCSIQPSQWQFLLVVKQEVQEHQQQEGAAEGRHFGMVRRSGGASIRPAC